MSATEAQTSSSSGHRTCTETGTRSFQHVSCATFHSLKLRPKHQGTVCCEWHSEYCSAERQSLQFRACFGSSHAQKRLTAQSRRSEVENEKQEKPKDFWNKLFLKRPGTSTVLQTLLAVSIHRKIFENLKPI